MPQFYVLSSHSIKFRKKHLTEQGIRFTTKNRFGNIKLQMTEKHQLLEVALLLPGLLKYDCAGETPQTPDTSLVCVCGAPPSTHTSDFVATPCFLAHLLDCHPSLLCRGAQLSYVTRMTWRHSSLHTITWQFLTRWTAFKASSPLFPCSSSPSI